MHQRPHGSWLKDDSMPTVFKEVQESSDTQEAHAEDSLEKVDFLIPYDLSAHRFHRLFGHAAL